ncbi:MAG: hypothetical protein ACXAC5_00145 [Promethearchaeota archaeon]|jgi:hypothetical protein
MKRTQLDNSALGDTRNRLEKAIDIINRKQGSKVDLVKEKVFTRGGPFLHQDSQTMTEKESAEFERQNPELFAYLRALDQQLGDLL